MLYLKHKSDEDLVKVLKQGAVYRSKLQREIKDLEQSLGRLKSAFKSSAVQSQFACKYLSGDTSE